MSTRKIRNARQPAWTLILALALAFLCALSPSPVLAQEGEEGEAATEKKTEKKIDEDLSFFATTSVTATGSEIDTFDIPTPVIVIEAERIEELQRIEDELTEQIARSKDAVVSREDLHREALGSGRHRLGPIPVEHDRLGGPVRHLEGPVDHAPVAAGRARDVVEHQQMLAGLARVVVETRRAIVAVAAEAEGAQRGAIQQRLIVEMEDEDGRIGRRLVGERGAAGQDHGEIAADQGQNRRYGVG